MPSCRFCQAELTETFADLGRSPLSNAYLTAEQLQKDEPFYPLHAWVCLRCFLVQIEAFETPDAIFGDYAYFSSYSDTWLEHCRDYAQTACRRFGLSARSLVVELASNDGYLLQYFMQKGVPVLGVEPAANVAQAAIAKGIPTEIVFFGVEQARRLLAEGRAADLIIGNNVLAHVPDLNDFVEGIKILLKPGGVITIEVPHLLRLIENNQFDTIYHEHFSYFSFRTAEDVFAAHGLRLFDVDELPTHGGSLRLYGCHDDDARPTEKRVEEMRQREFYFGLRDMHTYWRFQDKVEKVKADLLRFLRQAKDQGNRVVGYGAPAKGNTLLNACGVTTELLPFTVDRSEHKQGKYLPGSHIPIRSPQAILEEKPDYVLILPWNLKDEICEQMAAVRSWGGKFVVPIPRLEVLA